jgi:hypothetical protein
VGNSFLLIVVGLLLFYLVISNKWKCVEGFAACVLDSGTAPTTGAPAPPSVPNPTGGLPQVIAPPTIGTLVSNSNLLLRGIYGI